MIVIIFLLFNIVHDIVHEENKPPKHKNRRRLSYKKAVSSSKPSFLTTSFNEVKKQGFQDQEDSMKLGNEERNVRVWYVSTAGSR